MLTSKPRLPLKEIILVGLLPSLLKKLVYRMRGHRIGANVSLGFGAVICGEDVEIGAGAQFGFFSIVRGQTLRIGAHVQIGAMSFLDTPWIELGEGTKINEQVFIGGLQFPDSKLIVGRNCQIMQMSFINPTKSIRIGDDTGIGGDCLVFGHTSWLSAFEGYPVDFDSIEIGNSVSIAWRVFVLPGTRIGDGAVIGANSLVRGTIPPRCLAVGFPARVVSKAPEMPREVSPEEKQRLLREIVAEMIAYLRGFGLQCEERSEGWRISRKVRRWWSSSGRQWTLSIQDSPSAGVAANDAGESADVVLSLPSLSAAQRQAIAQRGGMWIDIEQKERSDHGNELGEEVAQYLKRYGVRLLRWRSP